MTAARILVVDDEADIRMLIDEILSDEGYHVATAADAREAREKYGSQAPDLVLLDIWMPGTDGITLLKEWSGDEGTDCPVVMLSGHGTIETAIEATRYGATEFLEKPVSIAKLLLTVEKMLLDHPRSTQREVPARLPPQMAPLGKSEMINRVRRSLEQVASVASPVLLIGEPGTGRTAGARYLHAMSMRQDRPFIAVGADDLSSEHAAATLLGSADGEPGIFARADGGVVLIRELADISAEAQRILLDVLERGDYPPAGRLARVRADVRFCATITPQAQVDPGHFGVRADLVEQLAIPAISVPPLREYAEDVPELLRTFVEQFVDENRLPFRRFGVAAQNRLRNYPWPGNVRELRALVRRLLVMPGPEEIPLDELESALRPVDSADASLLKQDLLSLPLREAREHFEKAYLTQQLALCDGKVGLLAQRVGMERTHLYRKLRALGVNFRRTD